MASDRQIRANRANAQKSLGPRTAVGKLKSSRNALRHGLMARQVILDNEAPALFEIMRQDLIRKLKPATTIEWRLVDHLAVVLWRLRRAGGYEAALFRYLGNDQACDDDPTGVTIGGVFIPTHAHTLARADGRVSGRIETNAVRTGRLLNSLLSPADQLSKLGRYEAHLLRQVGKTLEALKRLAALR